MKTHLKRIIGDVKLTYEEFSALLTQIEACLNSRPLVPLPNDDDGIEALTPDHFIVGKTISNSPQVTPNKPISLLKRWQLCQSLMRHFWKCWSSEYISQLGRFNKWQHPTRNVQPRDLVAIYEYSPISTKWPLPHVICSSWKG